MRRSQLWGGQLDGAPSGGPPGSRLQGGPCGEPGSRKDTYLRAGRSHQVDPRRGRQRSRGRAQGGGDDSVWRAQGVQRVPHRAQGPRGAHRGVGVAGAHVCQLPRGQGCRWAHGRGTGVAGGACGGEEHREGLGAQRPTPNSAPCSPLPATPVNPKNSSPLPPAPAGSAKSSRGQRGACSRRSAHYALPGPRLGLRQVSSRDHGGHRPQAPRPRRLWPGPAGQERRSVPTPPGGGGAVTRWAEAAGRCAGCCARYWGPPHPREHSCAHSRASDSPQSPLRPQEVGVCFVLLQSCV